MCCQVYFSGQDRAMLPLLKAATFWILGGFLMDLHLAGVSTSIDLLWVIWFCSLFDCLLVPYFMVC